MKKIRNIYIAKSDTWFNEGKECELIVDLENGSGIFSGFRTCENPGSEGRHNIGDVYLDEELCTMDEFVIKEE